MNALLQQLSLTLLQKNWEDCSVAQLEQYVRQHPMAGAFHLLYAQKLKEQQSPAYTNAWQKALLYYNNPLFVNTVFDTREAAQPAAVLDTTPELKIPSLKIEPLDPAKAELSYTPYHTVDYFASLGIKLSDEVKTTDKFGKQLRSFTDWLKEMRRLPDANISGNIPLSEVADIEKIAANSIEGENAITESMAQVWVKQDNPKKAIEIYKKLSLQNPSKRAYFAAKIDHLKKSL